MADDTKPPAEEKTDPTPMKEIRLGQEDLSTRAHGLLKQASARKQQERVNVVRRPFHAGRTVEDVYARGVGEKCACGRPGVGYIRSFMEVREFKARHPDRAALIMFACKGPIPTVKMTFGDMMLIGTVTPCAQCFSTAEKVAAKAPSYVLVEIRRSPKHNPLVAVPGFIGSRSQH